VTVNGDNIKCRYCAARFDKFTVLDGHVAETGWAYLQEHVDLQHPEISKKMIEEGFYEPLEIEYLNYGDGIYA